MCLLLTFIWFPPQQLELFNNAVSILIPFPSPRLWKGTVEGGWLNDGAHSNVSGQKSLQGNVVDDHTGIQDELTSNIQVFTQWGEEKQRKIWSWLTVLPSCLWRTGRPNGRWHKREHVRAFWVSSYAANSILKPGDHKSVPLTSMCRLHGTSRSVSWARDL